MSERIDHMTYLPGMEKIKSDVMDKVTAAMDGRFPSHFSNVK